MFSFDAFEAELPVEFRPKRYMRIALALGLRIVIGCVCLFGVLEKSHSGTVDEARANRWSFNSLRLDHAYEEISPNGINANIPYLGTKAFSAASSSARD